MPKSSFWKYLFDVKCCETKLSMKESRMGFDLELQITQMTKAPIELKITRVSP